MILIVWRKKLSIIHKMIMNIEHISTGFNFKK